MIWYVLYGITICISIFFMALGVMYCVKETQLTSKGDITSRTFGDVIIGLVGFSGICVILLIIIILPIINIVASFYFLKHFNDIYKEELESNHPLNEYYYRDRYNTLSNMLVRQNILTKEQINELIDSKYIADTLSKN